ncbi:HD-GYP domain-containing protein [Desulforudis sp. 1088]|uniref:HD-GYP domain-containing protein n=1 Tax=Desulforudis sp. Tu-874 TaxID=3416276 RepID=UPI003CE4AF9B
MQTVRKRQSPSFLHKQPLVPNQYLFHLYLWSVVLVGWGILFNIGPGISTDLTRALAIQLLIWSIITFFGEFKSIIRIALEQEITVAFAVHIAAIIYFGVPFALIVAAVSSALIDLLGRRGFQKLLFNVGQYSISIWATGFVFYTLKQSDPLTRLNLEQDFLAILVGCSIYVMFNWLLVSTVISLSAKLRLRDILSNHFKAQLSHFAALTPVAILLVLLYEQNPLSIILLALPLMMTHNSLTQHMVVINQARETIELLSDTIDERDKYTASHSKRVAEYARMIAEEMALKAREIEEIYMAGRVHDLGKISIPDSILLKSGRLTDEEFAVVKAHPKTSFFLLSRIKMYEQAARLALHHHERYDGKGYPTGLKGQSIPLGSRVLAVADAYDAMTTDRPYRRALSRAQALAELERHKGTQFDPGVVNSFIRVLSRKEVQD